MVGVCFYLNPYRLGDCFGVLPKVGKTEFLRLPAGCKNLVTLFYSNDLGYIIMVRFFHPLLMVLARASESEFPLCRIPESGKSDSSQQIAQTCDLHASRTAAVGQAWQAVGAGHQGIDYNCHAAQLCPLGKRCRHDEEKVPADTQARPATDAGGDPGTGHLDGQRERLGLG